MHPTYAEPVVLLLAILFFAVPIAELAVLISVGQQIGIADTILLMIGVSVVGAFMARRQGLGVLREVQRRTARGEVPGKELTDGLLVFAAAVLLLTPGFVTDGVALLLLVPPVRAGIRAVVRRRFEKRVTIVEGFDGPRSRRRTVDVDPLDPPDEDSGR